MELFNCQTTEEKGYEADRAYFGSEDGEAVLYRKKGTKDWHFLTHMDPGFIEDEPEDILEDLERLPEDLL